MKYLEYFSHRYDNIPANTYSIANLFGDENKTYDKILFDRDCLT